MTYQTKKWALTLGVAVAMTAGTVQAEVPENVADRLGKDLTPMGAERAGTPQGVAKWTGKGIDAMGLLDGYSGGPLPDLYAADVLVTP